MRKKSQLKQRKVGKSERDIDPEARIESYDSVSSKYKDCENSNCGEE